MGSWTIYSKNGVAKAVVKELELHDEWMAECFLTLTIKSATPIQFGVGDYLDYRGERYTIEYDPNVIKRATSGTYGEGFVYDGIKFVGSQDEIVRCDFNDIVLSDNNVHYTALPTFPFYCESVDDLLDRIQANLEDLYPNQWIVIGLNTVRNSQRGSVVGRQTAFENAYKKWIDPDMTPRTDPYGKQSVAESADNITCWDALTKVHEDFGLNFIVRGKVVVVGTAGVFTANTFQYGKGNGLEEIEKVGDSSQQIVTRLRAYGSETNLPLHYYSAINMLPYGNVVAASATGLFQIDVAFKKEYFVHEFSSGETDVVAKVGDVSYNAKAYVNGITGNININIQTAVSVAANAKVYITEGVKRDMWPNDHKDYSQDALPENMAVSRLMLPMFPNTSLYDWVKAHRDAGTTYNDETGLATYHGITAYFSKEPHRPYIDSLNKAQYGVRPASIYFDGSNETEDIHPTLEGMTYNNVRVDAVFAADQIEDNGVYDDSSVTVPNFHITLPDLGFNLAEVYEENASIDMKDGMCGGRSFKLAAKPTQDSNGRWVCEVQREKDDNLNLFFPYCDFQISSGDHYVLTGIQMPDAYIEAAAVKLLGAALDALQKNEAPRFTYQPKIDKNFMQRQHDTAMSSQGVVSLHDTLKAGDVFVFADANMGVDASIIIDVLTIKENGDNGIPTYEVTLRDEKQVSTIQKIQNKIESVINGGININSGVSGLTAQQVRSLINNYGGEQFLSKLNNDIAAGYITMLKGLQVGANFVPDILGEGGCFRMRQDGKVELVTDILYARMKAYFDSVEIREYQHTGGNRIASVAGNKICRVAWFNSSNVELEQTQANLASVAYFRCYFRASDGEDTVKNNWVVGDLAYCHVTSIVNSSDNPEQKGLNQKHLWRLVIGRNTEGTLTEDGEAYIDLSNRSTETISDTSYTGYQSGSDTPEAQDDIIQLGNVNDTTRQGAIVEFVTGTDAPSYQIYQGINSFSLNNKNQIGFGYNTGTGRAYMNVYGDFRFGARPNTQGSYLEYNSQTGALNIKAHVEFTNTDQELDTLVQNHQRDDSYDDTEVRGLISGLQEQIDGQIETWFYNYSPVNVDASGAPTSNVPLNVAPYSDWTTDNDKIAHLGDTFTNNSTGYCWRFTRNEETNAFEWVVIEDSAVIAALQNAARAQDTADHKRRVFICDSSHQTPTPPYDAGDLWVNVKYPWATGATYDNEILKCVTSKASGSFAIADWSLANGYTAKLNNFVNNTYAPFVQNIQGQVDKKAETFRQATDPSSSWTDADKPNHVGDLWMDISADGGKKTKIYQNIGTDANPVYDWVEQEVPDEVFDEIDGKAEIFVTKPTTYNERDMWIIESGTAAADIPTGCQVGDIVVSNHKRTNSYTKGDWSKKDRYTDDSKFNGYINAFLNGTGASGDSATAAAIQKAIAGALGSGTIVDGGLLLTSLIGMRKNIGTTESPVYETWAGISGQYDDWSGTTHAKGHGIAAWYGGAMVDKEDVQTLPASYAKSLFRFDGSGYLASGNITWNENGSLTIKNITTLSDSNNNNILNELATFNSAFTFGTSGQGSTTALYITPNVPFESLYIGTSNANKKEVATQEWVGNNYVSTAFFRQLFRAFKPNATAGQADVEVQPNTIDATISNIKAMVGFWTEQYVSALGNSSDGGGGGGGASVLYGLNDVTPNATGDGVMGAQDGYVLTYNGTTNHWYAAATAETYVLPTATSDALGGIKIGYNGTTAKTYAVALDTNGKAYVNVPWTDNNTWIPWAGATENAAGTAGYMPAPTSAQRTQFLRGDGTWVSLNNYSLPLAASGARGGVQVGYTTDGANRNYAVQLSSEKMYVNVPWTDTTYSVFGGSGSTAAAGLVPKPSTTAGTTKFLREDATWVVPDYPTNYIASDTSRTANTVLAAPNGQNGAATFRVLVAADIPNLGASKINSGTFDAARIPDLSSTYAAVARVTTLEGYFTSGVANKAEQLNTSRTIWGQSFDGSANVSGDMSGVGNITPSSDYSKNIGSTTLEWYDAYIRQVNARHLDASGVYTGDHSLYIGWGCSAYTDRTLFYYSSSTSSRTQFAEINSNGFYALTRFGVNGQSTSYNLYVNGTFYASGNSSIGGTFGVTGATTLTGLLTANGGIAIDSSKTLKIGDIYLAYDSTNNAIEVYKLDGTSHVAANLYARGGIAALGETSDGQAGTGDVTWALLASSSDTRQIASSHLTTALSSYLPLSGGIMDNTNLVTNLNADYLDGYHESSFLRERGRTYTNGETTLWSQIGIKGYYGALPDGLSDTYNWGEVISFAGSDARFDIYVSHLSSDNNGLFYRSGWLNDKKTWVRFIDSSNIGSQSVNYATSAGSANSVTWSNVSSTPTTLSGYGITDGLYSTEVAEAQDNVTWAQNYANTHRRCFVYNTSGDEWSYLFGIRTNIWNGAILKMGYPDRYLRLLRVANGNWSSTDWEKIYAGYADSAGSVAWANVTSHPTKLSQFTNDSGFVTSSGVTSVATGTGLTGGTITSTGTISINSTYQTYISNGNTAYGWGNHANAGYATQSWVGNNYLPLSGGTMSDKINFGFEGKVCIDFRSNSQEWGSKIEMMGSGNDAIVWANRQSVTSFMFFQGIELTDTNGWYNLGTPAMQIKNNCVAINKLIGNGVTPTYTLEVAGKIVSSSNTNSVRMIPDADCGLYMTSSGQWLHIAGNGGLMLFYNGAWDSTATGNYNKGICINTSNNIGIGTISPSYKLHVSGDIYATGGVTSLSDIRKKNVISYELPLNVEQIANAPTIKFLWKDKREEGEQIGTIAQYWQKVLPWVVKDKSNELSMQYGVAALVAAITTARKVVDHEKRITELEKECERLRTENEQLKLKIA